MVLIYWCPVQRYDQRGFLLESICRRRRSSSLGQHPAQARQHCQEGPGTPFLGQIQVLQDRPAQRGVLLPTFQPQQVLPFLLIGVGNRKWKWNTVRSCLSGSYIMDANAVFRPAAVLCLWVPNPAELSVVVNCCEKQEVIFFDVYEVTNEGDIFGWKTSSLLWNFWIFKLMANL